ncbi:hypothetical protein QJQ45_010974 [Haematococcus lacustris]|nr:hypothetical protein QJQ45_010974 [Haematococcus lacustris]
MTIQMALGGYHRIVDIFDVDISAFSGGCNERGTPQAHCSTCLEHKPNSSLFAKAGGGGGAVTCEAELAQHAKSKAHSEAIGMAQRAGGGASSIKAAAKAATTTVVQGTYRCMVLAALFMVLWGHSAMSFAAHLQFATHSGAPAMPHDFSATRYFNAALYSISRTLLTQQLAAHITAVILRVIDTLSLDVGKLVAFCSVGASTFMGAHNAGKRARKKSMTTNRDLQAEVQRLHDVEQSLMSTVDGLQGDLDDLQAAHQGLQGLHSQLQHLVPADQREQQKQQLATYLQEHCGAMWTYYQHHVQAQMALPHLFAALGSLDQATRMEVAIDVVYHAELRLPPPEDGQQQQQQQQQRMQQQQQQQQQQEDPYGTWRQYASDIRAMAVNGDPGSPALRLHLEQYYLACPISNAPVESLLQLLKHGGGRYMELPALLQLMSLHTCKEAMKTVDVHDLQQHMGQLRAEVRRKEDATAAAQRSAKAERQITDAAHKVGRVVINVGDHACQQRLAAAHALAFGGHDYGHTTVEEAMKMTGKQLQSYLQFHKQEVHTSWRVPKLLSHVCTHIRGKLAAAAPPQQQLTPAGTTPELAEPAGAPPQQQQQLAAASTSRKRGAPAANKSRAAKQGATHNSVAKRASAARLVCGEIA